MQATINGQSREVEKGVSVSELLMELHLDVAACAVEVNRQLVPKSQHAAYEIRDGDQIEVVTLVGGG